MNAPRWSRITSRFMGKLINWQRSARKQLVQFSSPNRWIFNSITNCRGNTWQQVVALFRMHFSIIFISHSCTTCNTYLFYWKWSMGFHKSSLAVYGITDTLQTHLDMSLVQFSQRESIKYTKKYKQRQHLLCLPSSHIMTLYLERSVSTY